MQRFILAVAFLLMIGNNSYSQTLTTQMLDNALGAVVTVAIYETDIAMKPMGFRGAPGEMAYSKALDLTGAKSSGSGFVIERNGKKYVVTNAHVVESAADENIFLYSVNYKKYKVRILGGDSFYDFAILEFVDMPGSEISTLKFRTTEAKVGEQVYAIGNPLGDYPYTVTDGIISAKNRVRGGLTGKFGFLQSTATVIWGNSGGPLVDIGGNVVGINSQIAFAKRGEESVWQPQINFALEAPIANRLADDVISNNGVIKRAYLGLEISRSKMDNYYKPVQMQGLNTLPEINVNPMISAVLPAGPANNALSPYVGFNIQTINNEPVRNVEEALGIFEKIRPGEEVSFNLVRNGVTQNVKFKTQTSDEASTAAIGKFLIQKFGGQLSGDMNGLTLDFVDRNMYTGFKKTSTEYISTIGADDNQKSDVLFDSHWLVVAAGLMLKSGNNIWKVKDAADLGSAIRLCGLTGIVDLILFRKDADPRAEYNYIQKRFMLSGEDHVYKETLWY